MTRFRSVKALYLRGAKALWYYGVFVLISALALKILSFGSEFVRVSKLNDLLNNIGFLAVFVLGIAFLALSWAGVTEEPEKSDWKKIAAYFVAAFFLLSVSLTLVSVFNYIHPDTKSRSWNEIASIFPSIVIFIAPSVSSYVLSLSFLGFGLYRMYPYISKRIFG